MTRRRITSRDVAKRAGVSRTTVSFVLNRVKGANISEETSQRVLAAAEELGYVPDAAAQALASGRAKTIGMVFRAYPHITTDLAHFQIIEGLMAIARQFGVRLLVDSVSQTDTADTYVNLTRTKRIDGLILSDSRVDDRALRDLANDGFPIVLLGRLPDVEVCSVEFDNRGGARMATEHLLALGHSRIGFIGYAPAEHTGVVERLRGYQDALASAGVAFDQTFVRYGYFTADSGFDAAQNLLAASPRPTALFVTSDVLAFGALAAIHECGLTIPDDIAIVGFDDNPLAHFARPALTTIRLSFEEMGRQAGKMLLDRIRDNTDPVRQVQLATEVIVRASSERQRQ
jgi:LacI family transcriptional regulator